MQSTSSLWYELLAAAAVSYCGTSSSSTMGRLSSVEISFPDFSCEGERMGTGPVLCMEPHFPLPASEDVMRMEYELTGSLSLLWWIPYKKYTRSPKNWFTKMFNTVWNNHNNTNIMTASLVLWSACLTSDHEVAGSIPGTSTNFKCGLGLEWGPPSLVRTIG